MTALLVALLIATSLVALRARRRERAALRLAGDHDGRAHAALARARAAEGRLEVARQTMLVIAEAAQADLAARSAAPRAPINMPVVCVRCASEEICRAVCEGNVLPVAAIEPGRHLRPTLPFVVRWGDA